MKIFSVCATNYRSFKELKEIKFGDLSTLIGQNDVGKSNILQCLNEFFSNKPKLEINDIHRGDGELGDITIEVAFTNLPANIELEEGVIASFKDELLLDSHELLRVRKKFAKNSLPKFETYLIVQDYADEKFSGLYLKKESELNTLCQDNGIEYSQSGRGITNKEKRKKLREKARDLGIEITSKEIKIDPKTQIFKIITQSSPQFVIFESDTKLGVGETSFQSQFKPIIQTVTSSPSVKTIKDQFTGAIDAALQCEVNEIFSCFRRHTDTFQELKASPSYSWEKAITFDIIGKDQQGTENSIDRRGSGIRRILMVAFFQYLTEKKLSEQDSYVFAVEEPENCLHPHLQRELINSFKKLSDEGSQIIITSHSPIFAGLSPIDDISLIKRQNGVASAQQVSDFTTPEEFVNNIAEDLGVEPSDQITGYNACIFVEGPTDIDFLRWTASKLKEGGVIQSNFEDKNIGFVILGGDNIKHWIDRRAMHRLNKRFGVMIDGDRKNAEQHIPQKKLNWKKKCEEDGGIFFILRKRDIENYIHPDAIRRAECPGHDYGSFSDMKAIFGPNVYKYIHDMLPEEILQMDLYEEGEIQKHEIKEIIEKFLELSPV